MLDPKNVGIDTEIMLLLRYEHDFGVYTHVF